MSMATATSIFFARKCPSGRIGQRPWIIHAPIFGSSTGTAKAISRKITIFKGGYGTHEARLADFFDSGRLDILSKPYEEGAPGVDIWVNPGRR